MFTCFLKDFQKSYHTALCMDYVVTNLQLLDAFVWTCNLFSYSDLVSFTWLKPSNPVSLNYFSFASLALVCCLWIKKACFISIQSEFLLFALLHGVKPLLTNRKGKSRRPGLNLSWRRKHRILCIKWEVEDR